MTDQTMDTMNPIKVEIEDPEGKAILSGYAWRVPAVGDTITLPASSTDDDGALELVSGEVVHRHWHPTLARSEPLVTIVVELGSIR